MQKLGLDEKQALGAAFAISNKLKNEGSEYYKEGGTDLLEILYSQQVLDYIGKNAQDIVAEQIEIEIVDYMKSAFKK